MNLLKYFFSSSIGKKWVVALTGLAMIGFLVGHLVGNLQIFLPPEHINQYAAFLKSIGELLWVVRIALIGAVLLHILFTIQLTVANRRARPEAYALKRSVQAKTSTKTMIWSGSYLLCFIIVHLLHLTFETIHPEYRLWHDEAGRADVYRMVIVGFSNPFMAGFYIIGMVLLLSHLSHGVGSAAQTLGLRTKRAAALLSTAGRLLAIVLGIGFISIPVAVQAGWGRKYVEERKHAELPAQAATPAPEAK